MVQAEGKLIEAIGGMSGRYSGYQICDLGGEKMTGSVIGFLMGLSLGMLSGFCVGFALGGDHE